MSNLAKKSFHWLLQDNRTKAERGENEENEDTHVCLTIYWLASCQNIYIFATPIDSTKRPLTSKATVFLYNCTWLYSKLLYFLLSIMSEAFTVCMKAKTYLHCQTQFQSLRTGWGLSSVICPSSSSIRASVSGGAHSWSRSVAARIRFPEDTKALCYTPLIPCWLLQYTEPHAHCDSYIMHMLFQTNCRGL